MGRLYKKPEIRGIVLKDTLPAHFSAFTNIRPLETRTKDLQQGRTGAPYWEKYWKCNGMINRESSNGDKKVSGRGVLTHINHRSQLNNEIEKIRPW